MISEPAALGRRAFLTGGLALAFLAALPGALRANPVQRAEGLVAQLSGDLITLVNSGRSEAQLYGEFERILARYGDMPAVAASILGPPWRQVSSSQQQRFVAAFQTYLSRKYGRQFREYRNAEIRVERARDAGNAGVLVRTRIVRPGQPALAVDWQVSERSGQPRVVNLTIEGISMLANERAEIAALLERQRGSVDGLIRELGGRA
jgi:phospholipid transport system substrate-binding protein